MPFNVPPPFFWGGGGAGLPTRLYCSGAVDLPDTSSITVHETSSTKDKSLTASISLTSL